MGNPKLPESPDPNVFPEFPFCESNGDLEKNPLEIPLSRNRLRDEIFPENVAHFGFKML